MHEMSRLREFFHSIETTVKMLKTNKEFRSKFDALLNLAKSPFVKALLGDSLDIATIEMVLKSVINDQQVTDIITTIGNIFDCYSTDRFIGVASEQELENVAYELAKKKLFYAAIYFTSDGKTNETTYKLRMEVDNSPVTIENRNRFWFPGPEASFELEMRYHRGFIEMQSAVDVAIIKVKKNKQFDALKKDDDDLDFSDIEFDDDAEQNSNEDDFDLDFAEENTSQKNNKKEGGQDETTEDFAGLSLDDLDNNETTTSSTEASTKTSIDTTTTTSTTTTTAEPINYAEIYKAFENKINISDSDVKKFSDDNEDFEDDFWNFNDEPSSSTQASSSRRKRQLDSILSMLGINNKKQSNELSYNVDDMSFYTKQFPYPKHTRDDFKKGLYLAQAIQMCFFFALIVLISSSVRQKIWFKESGNLSVSFF
jgi:hypothetical protein